MFFWAALFVFSLLLQYASLASPKGVSAAQAAADLDQCRNGAAASPNNCEDLGGSEGWVNGNAGSSNAHYAEGQSIPYRVRMTDLPVGQPITLELGYDVKHSDHHAIDYLTSFDRISESVSPLDGVTGVSATVDNEPIPAPPVLNSPVAGQPTDSFNALPASERLMTLFGGTISGITYGAAADLSASQAEQTIFVEFTPDSATAVLSWGGHIGSRLDWGFVGTDPRSAGGISGSPYHMRLKDWTGQGLGNLGNQDRSLSADAVTPPGGLTVVKTVTGAPQGWPGASFPVSVDCGAAGSFNGTITYPTPGSITFTGIAAGSVCTATEGTLPAPPADYSWGIPSYSGNPATISSGGTAQIGITNSLTQNPHPHLTITKDTTTQNYSKVGDVISYQIVATNDGNTTLASVTVTDPNASGLSCTPANGSPLSPGATMTCTASHTVTQADIDAGHYFNQACVDDGEGGAAQACDDVDVPGTKSPALSITKDATEASYDSTSDVIHYTIVATNVGNTTLTSVTVTDSEAVLGTCTPANGSSLAPGEFMTCAATHAVTQADIDAGTYNNTACVDDGQGGAAQACDDADVPSSQGPALSITKVAAEQGYNAVGQVIHYTIVATNVGNTTLASVTVTDPNASGLDCTPVNGSPLTPGAFITCTASHTVTQADIDAGHYFNQACVDDGEGGALQACDDVTTPGDQRPHLTITKDTTTQNYSKVGDVISYQIVATNDGNTTLASVTVTDPNASGLSCTPANGSPLSPGATMTCTASHTVTQADIDAGHYFNQACVDDGEGGAAQACDDVDVPSSQTPAIHITKVANPTSLPFGGGSVTYTYVVTNPGNTTLNKVTVTDVLSGTATTACSPTGPAFTVGNTDALLDPGETWTYTCTKTITQTTSNTATATGHYGEDGSVSDDDSATVTVAPPTPPALGSLTITKTLNPGTAFPGGTFTFNVSCGQQQTITLAAGQASGSVTINGLLLGTSCTVTEVTPLTSPGTGWQWVGVPQYAPGQTVTVPATVTVTNFRGEVEAATATPPPATLPPTDSIGGQPSSPSTVNLGLLLILFSGFMLGVSLLTPVPSEIRRRDRRG